MPPFPIRPLRWALLFALGGGLACKPLEAVPTLGASVAATPSDEALVFPCFYRGYTGLYRVQLATGAVSEVLPPQPGVLLDPNLSPDGRAVWYSFARPAAEGTQYGIATASLDGSSGGPLFTTPRPVLGLAVAPRAGRVYFVMAGGFGQSSPVAGPRYRSMEVYSAAPDGSHWQQVTHVGAYAIQPRLSVDAREEGLYLSLVFSAHARPNGPYRLNLLTQELTPLVPGNLRSFYSYWDGVNEGADPSFLLPVPNRTGDGYYLKGDFRLFAVGPGTGAAQLLYRQSEVEELRYHLPLEGLSRLNLSNRVVLSKAERRGSSYLLLDETGGHTPVTVDMTPFFSHFPAAPVPPGRSKTGR